jgi:hypothetical protein
MPGRPEGAVNETMNHCIQTLVLLNLFVYSSIEKTDAILHRPRHFKYVIYNFFLNLRPPLQNGVIQPLFALEMIIQHRFADTGPGNNFPHRGGSISL